MPDTPFEIEYNQDLGRLTALMESVDRAGGFVCSGVREGPLPRIDVDGLGTLAFPLLDFQAEALAAVAQAAPFGRGEDTIYDASVRNTRQLTAGCVHIGGKHWGETLSEILDEVRSGLGCGDACVGAELHKMLLYEKGGFFAPHRDTEKAEGMFATLVLALPSFHEGGDLIARHKDSEKRISLATQDVSEIRYAAFYADCEHEVLPVTAGYRLCLVYNLILTAGKAKTRHRLVAPDYDQTVERIAAELEEWKREDGSGAKIAWLLDHAYTPEGLSFHGLKHVDAARASVMQRAAERAGCALYLGIVHIEESGPAEIEYTGYDSYRGYDDEVEVDEAYEIVEVSDWEHRITDWMTPQDERIDFGVLPLGEGELLPAGALDGELPDEDRVTEATGNEGASFERSYHRAALVVWDTERTTGVVLHAGTAAAVAHLRQQVGSADLKNGEERERLRVAVQEAVQRWEDAPAPSWRTPVRGSGMADMLEVLVRLGDGEQIQAFIRDVVAVAYERGVNEALIACLDCVGEDEAQALASEVLAKKGGTHPAECIDLLKRLATSQKYVEAFPRLAETLIEVLPRKRPAHTHDLWMLDEAARPVAFSGKHIADLFEALRTAEKSGLVMRALKKLADHPKAYPPDQLLFPGVKAMQKRLRRGIDSDAAYAGLWTVAADFLLHRSASPPPEPKHWAQPVKKGCTCADCMELMRFAADPDARELRLPRRKDLRQHLHQRIEKDDIDMTHETERRGRPYTLVCTKTRRTHERRLAQYAEDVQQIAFLSRHAPCGEAERVSLLRAAVRRAGQILDPSGG